LNGRDGACRDDGDGADDGVDDKGVPTRNRSAIAAACVASERVIEVRCSARGHGCSRRH